MKLLINGTSYNIPRKLRIERDDAIVQDRAIDGSLNVDRMYSKDRLILEYEYLPVTQYNQLKALYNAQFTSGTFYQVQITETQYPINMQAFIEPTTITPRFAGALIENYELVLVQR